MIPQQLSLNTYPHDTGAARKAEGMALAAAHTDPDWADICDAAISQLAATGEEFQAADLAALGVPDPDHPNRWGPRLQWAAKHGLIEHAGFAPSRRALTAKSIVHTWRGVTPSQVQP